MKLTKKITLLTVAMSSTLVYAAEKAEYKDCAEIDGAKSCLTFQVSIPDYPAWLTDFVLPETFGEEDLSLAELQHATEEYVKATLPESESGIDDVEKVTWQPMEKVGNYVQLAKDEYLKSSEEEKAIESRSYYVFNTTSEPPQLLALKDILVSEEAGEKLGEILKNVYLNWQTKQQISESEAHAILDNYLEEGEMPISDNWFLAKGMIVFNYGTTEIGPSSYGSIDLAIPVHDLKDIITPEILQLAEQWP